MFFGIRSSTEAAVTRVVVTGEIDLSSIGSFRSELRKATGETVVVDLTECEFIDSIGLGIVIGAQRRCKLRHADLRVVASRRVSEIFDVTNVSNIVHIEVASD